MPPRFTLRSIGTRVEEAGDLFSPVLRIRQDLRHATEAIRKLTDVT